MRNHLPVSVSLYNQPYLSGDVKYSVPVENHVYKIHICEVLLVTVGSNNRFGLLVLVSINHMLWGISGKR